MKTQLRRWIEHGPYPLSAILCTGDGYPRLESKPYAGKCSASSAINASRVTFATTDAALMDSTLPSPLMIVVTRDLSPM
jgi:hypothetical protein